MSRFLLKKADNIEYSIECCPLQLTFSQYIGKTRLSSSGKSYCSVSVFLSQAHCLQAIDNSLRSTIIRANERIRHACSMIRAPRLDMVMVASHAVHNI